MVKYGKSGPGYLFEFCMLEISEILGQWPLCMCLTYSNYCIKGVSCCTTSDTSKVALFGYYMLQLKGKKFWVEIPYYKKLFYITKSVLFDLVENILDLGLFSPQVTCTADSVEPANESSTPCDSSQVCNDNIELASSRIALIKLRI